MSAEDFHFYATAALWAIAGGVWLIFLFGPGPGSKKK